MQELLETARGNGFLDTFDSVAEAEAVVGELILNKLGMVENTRDDGTIKRRLIWDLRESEVNRSVYLGERVVLPRLEDAADDRRELHRLVAGDELLRMLVLDISDAWVGATVEIRVELGDISVSIPEKRRLEAADATACIEGRQVVLVRQMRSYAEFINFWLD